MRLTWLGWAGVELEEDGVTVVIDPLDDAGAVFAPLGEQSAGTPVPEVVPASAGKAVAGLVTHLHRDHADARALTAALAPGAPVLEPPAGGGGALEGLALAQAEHELAAAGLERREVAPWESVTAGPFTLTALPASDGVGDPQVAWLVEAGGVRVLHLGDTMFHGYWWRMALRHGPFDVVLVPVNGAVVGFPHRTPASPLPVGPRSRAGRGRRRDPRRAARHPDPRRGLRDRRRVPAGPGRGAAIRRRGGGARRAGADPGGGGDDRAQRGRGARVRHALWSRAPRRRGTTVAELTGQRLVLTRRVGVRLGGLEERPELLAHLRCVLVPVHRCGVLGGGADDLVLLTDDGQ